MANIKGTDVFTGYEYVPCHESESCESCPFSKFCYGKELDYKSFCRSLTKGRYGNWVSVMVVSTPVPRDVTPDKPGCNAQCYGEPDIAGHPCKNQCRNNVEPPKSYGAMDVIPTVPGWYQVRFVADDSKECIKTPRKIVFKEISELEIKLGYCQPLCMGHMYRFDLCQFYGPILPPARWTDGADKGG